MKIIILFLGLIFCTLSNAQNHKVVSRSALNVRENPDKQSNIIGRVSSGDIVYVINKGSKWSQINYNNQTGLVSNKYILPLQSRSKRSAESYFQGLANLFYQGPLSYLPLLIFLAFILVLILRRIFINYDTTRISIGVIGLIATCTMELFYFIHYNVGIPWFCTPDTIGWLWTIINFLLYGFILSNQIRLCFEVIAELSKDNAFNLQIGIFSIPIAVILFIIFYIADIDMIAYILGGLMLAQVVQIIVNFKLIHPWTSALLVSFLFILNTVAIICSSIYFIVMLLFIFIAIMALSLFGSGLGGSRYVRV